MALKIRLRQQGRTNRTVYRVVVADVRSPRDGKYVESIGWYNPIESVPEKTLFLNTSRMQYWLDRGAQLTESVDCLVKKAAPELKRRLTEKKLALREKTRAKKKANKKAAA
jgi:small subunit ribosomal protein S16